MRSPLRYSPSTGAFYHAGLHGDVPADAVTVTAARHRELLEGQAKGRRIVAGADGKPVLAAPPRPTLEQLRGEAVRRVKLEARRRILAIASIERQANDNGAIALAAIAGDTSAAAAPIARRRRIDAIRAASDAIEAQIARMPAANLTNFDAGADRLWPESLSK